MAQATSTSQNLCLRTEEALQVITGMADPSQIEVQTFGTIKAINDSQSGIKTDQLTGGKLKPGASNDRIITVQYHKPDCGAVAECSDVDFDCTDVSDAIETYAYDRNSIDRCVATEFAIDHTFFTGNCIDLSVDLRNKFKAALRKMRKAKNDAALSWLYSSVGNYFAQSGQTAVASGTTTRALPILDASFDPQPLGFFQLERQYEDMGVGDRNPYVVSGSGLWKAYMYADQKNIFSRGDDDGVKPTVTVPNAYYDKRVDPVVTGAGGGGSNYAISWTPGAVADLQWYEYDNVEAATVNGRKVWAPYSQGGRTVRQKVDIGTAIDGIPFVVDMFVFYDDCNNKVIYKMKQNYDFWKIPDDAFVAACDQTHNYLLLWTFEAAALASTDFTDIVA